MEISRKMNRKSNLQPVRCTSCKVTSPETQLNHNDVQVETFSAQTFHSRKKKKAFGRVQEEAVTAAWSDRNRALLQSSFISTTADSIWTNKVLDPVKWLVRGSRPRLFSPDSALIRFLPDQSLPEILTLLAVQSQKRIAAR